ncbi:MAG TPA: sugar phosphate isomerase/epimerase family protein [Tepidisphaeraceae bacterium]|jgi:sugar phosphate isomerase/epimerase|nr:sugar phosphate isomerase/epimerase family protein [Tepidisphaeraceae bacterium]
MPNISFISANYVGRALNYRGPADWMPNDAATLKAASPDHFASIAFDIAAAGFEAIDIWTAHCHWQHHASDDYIEIVKGICSQYDLSITSYAGGLHPSSAVDLEAPFKFMKQLGAPIFAGGMWGADPAEMAPHIQKICDRLGVRYALENHPEKSPQEILAKIAGGKFPRIGIALDTGWCGTQGIDAVECAKRLREKLFIVHLKDIKAAGAHDTCALGDGIVPIEKLVRYLLDSKWEGTLCIEHEPYDHDPMPDIKKSADRVRQWLR